MEIYREGKSKKICFIFMGNLYLCPYISSYIDNINCKFDVIYWDRDGIEEKIGAEEYYRFNYNMSTNNSKFYKLVGYVKFKKYAENILTKNNYERVIILQTSVGILLQKILIKKYSKRYLMDIRDYTFEKNKLFYILEKRIVNKSSITVISSEGYKKFLPPYKYILAHNNRKLDTDKVLYIRKRNKNKNRLVIAFIGNAIYQEQHKKVLNLFKNDNRFEIRYIGKNSEQLIEFCNENNIKNVKIVGRFKAENILDYYNDVDIIDNLYGNNNPYLDYALSNKLYFAAELCIPILVCKDTFMQEVSQKYGLGYTVDLNDLDTPNKLYNYYQNISWTKFKDGCNKFLEVVERDKKIYDEKIKKFIELEEKSYENSDNDIT